MAWTPLFDGIVMSSLWEEPLSARVLFTTMMALKDWNTGFVRGTRASLRRMANLSSEQFDEGLRILMAPDALSANREHDGRRVLEVEGGFQITGHAKYREMMTGVRHRRELDRERQARYREQKRQRMLEGEPEYCAKVKVGDEDGATDVLDAVNAAAVERARVKDEARARRVKKKGGDAIKGKEEE